MDAGVHGGQGLKVAIVLPPGYAFSAQRPNSIETVVRTLAAPSRFLATTRIFCDAGADHGDLPVVEIPVEGGRRRRVHRRIEAVGVFSPDIIEFHQHGPTAAAASRILKGPVRVFYRHRFVTRPKALTKRLTEAWRLKAFDDYVFVSRAARDAFAADYPALDDRSFAILNGVDSSLWTAPVEGREPIIAFAGRASPEKGFGLVCASIAQVLAARPDWRAELMLGEWQKHAEWAQAQLDQLSGVADRVLVAKSQPLEVVRQTLRRAAIALVPSTWREPFGLAAAEAHAAGAAVISSGTGGLREVSGAHALYVEPLNADALSQAMLTLIDQPARRLDLAASGQAFVAAEHSPERRAGQLDDLRERLVDGR